MYKITKHIMCELTASRTGTVEVSTGDRLTRAVACRLVENGAPWVVPEGAIVRICYTLPDGTDGIYSDLPDGSPAWMVAGNIVTIILHEQLMAQAGRYEISIVLIGPNGEQLATWPIRVQVVGPLKQTIPGNLPPVGAGFENRILFGGPGGVLIPLEVGDGLTIEGRVLSSTGIGNGGNVDLTGYATEKWVKEGYQPKGDYPLREELPSAAADVGLGNVANERQYSAQNPPPYPVTSVNGKSGAVQLGAADVGALPSTYTPPNQTAAQVGADPKGAAAAAVTAHNSDDAAHNDLRLEVKAIREQLAAFLDVDEETLNELSELIARIVANQTSIEQLTTGKVNVTDIVNNLTTNVTNKPLSAAQGVALKSLTDKLSTGKLDATALQSAIEDALAQAKESGDFNGNKGDPGRGIQSITRTSGDGTAGTVDTYTITYTDGTTGTYQVRNGADGEDGDEGITPHIGDNGNWYLGDTDTGVKAQGEDGNPGQRGTGILPTTTGIASYTTAVNGVSPKYRILLTTLKSQSGVSEVLIGDQVRYSAFLYPIITMDDSYAYMGTRVSLQGTTGAAGTAATFEITGVTGLAYGETPTVTEADGSTAQARKYVVGIPAGRPGDPYVLTEEDKAEIVARVIEHFGGQPLTAYVDENMNIFLSGNLPDGTYTASYEDADGNITALIGQLVKDTNTYYSVTNSLTNCVSSNGATEAVSGESYEATIAANSGYELESVTVTMGGVDISSTAVSGGTISIEAVTGNIVITAVAEEAPATPAYTNLADPASADWQEGYRLSLSSGSTAALAGHTTTNFIPCTAGDVLRVKGLNIVGIIADNTDVNAGAAKIVTYNASRTKINGLYGRTSGTESQIYGNVVSVDGDISTYTVLFDNTGEQRATTACAYIRIDGELMDGYTKDDVIITINEEIV